MEYYSLDKCTAGGTLQYSIDGSSKQVNFDLPVLVEVSKNLGDLKVFAAIDDLDIDSYLYDDIGEVLRAIIPITDISSLDAELWADCVRYSLSSAQKSATLIFLDGDDYQPKQNIEGFLSKWTASQDSFVHISVFTSPSNLAENLVRQISTTFNGLKPMGCSFSVTNIASIPLVSDTSFGGSQNSGSGSSSGGNNGSNSRKSMKRWLRDHIPGILSPIPGKYEIKLSTIGSEFVSTALTLIAGEYPVPKAFYTDHIFFEESSSYPDPVFFCRNRCSAGYFEISSSSHTGYDCLPISLLQKMEKVKRDAEKLTYSFEKIKRGFYGS